MDKSNNKNNQADIDGDISNSNIYINSNGGNQGSNKNMSPKNNLDILQWVVISILGIAFIAILFSIIALPLSGTAGTATPIPPTETSILTPLPISPVPLGEDWMRGCISTLWLAYPASIQLEERGDGCWREPIHAFSSENGDLDFLFENSSGGEEIYGLFARLPIESGSLTLTIRIRDLTNADLLIGIFSQPEVKSQGLLMMLSGGVNSNVFIQKDPFTYETLLSSQRVNQENGYSITFWFDNLSARSVVNPSMFFVDPISIPSSQKYLFLGYKRLSGYSRIEGTFRMGNEYLPNTPVNTLVAMTNTKTPIISPIISPTVSFTPNPTQIFKSVFDEIDRQFENLIKGNIAFVKPSQMEKDETASIELILSPSQSQSVLATQLVTQGVFITSTINPTALTEPSPALTESNPVLIGPSGESVTIVTNQVNVTPRMKAALFSQDPEAFSIQELHDSAEQVISSVETSTWRWSVTAKKEGSQTLELIIYQLVEYDGREFWHEVETYKADIVVDVTQSTRFISLDWKWIVSFVLALIGTVLAILTYKRDNKEKPLKNIKKKKN